MQLNPGSEEIHAKEAQFHDDWARATPLNEIAVSAAFESPAALENKFILQQMGDLKGKRLLDVGAGLGESSVYFAKRGADVTATDLSPAMLQTIADLAKLHGVKIQTAQSAAESLNVPQAHYDLVYIANTIHHVTDRAAIFQQIHRALKPGGRFFSIDPLAYNPVIGIYRKMATAVRTEDESPLTRADLALARRYFEDVRHREFWILGLALFLKFFLIDRVHPNADRYWKRIYKETRGSLWWWMPLNWGDRVLTRLPGVRWMGWNMVMWGTKRAE
jgi:SAM-dependent methyltransferase